MLIAKLYERERAATGVTNRVSTDRLSRTTFNKERGRPDCNHYSAENERCLYDNVLYQKKR
jgi:hypothetical protein